MNKQLEREEREMDEKISIEFSDTDWEWANVRHLEKHGNVWWLSSRVKSLEKLECIRREDLPPESIIREFRRYSGDPFIDHEFEPLRAYEISAETLAALRSLSSRRIAEKHAAFEKDRRAVAAAMMKPGFDSLPPDEQASIERIARGK